MTTTINRRDFLKTTLATSSVLVVGLNAGELMAAGDIEKDVVNPFIAIDENGKVTVVIKHFEMGQGTTTGLSTLIAEELDASWDQIDITFAPADNERYKNLFWGIQGTGGSSAMANSFTQYRQAGAMAKDLLVRAAAKAWDVPVTEISVADGKLTAGSKSAGFGDFVGLAKTLTPNDKVALKKASDFKLIGKPVLSRKDNPGKVNGTAKFAMDINLPGMLHVAIKRSPRFGGKLKDFNADKAKAMPGFVDAKALPNGAGVAVYATNTWNAFKARDAIEATWDDSGAETKSTAAIEQAHRELTIKPEYEVHGKTAEAETMLKDAKEVIEAEFLSPYLAHAPMEPLNCVIEPTENGVKFYDGCQAPGLVRAGLPYVLGLKPEQIEIETVYAGGSFGRRATPTSDYQSEAAMAFMLMGSKTPLKLVWSREDDIHGGYYRPMAFHRVKIGLNDGDIAVWDHRIVTQPILKGTPFGPPEGVDQSSVEGVAESLYQIPNHIVSLSDYKTPVPPLWWRAVGHTHTAWAMESTMDMVAEKTGQDPIDLRLSLLDESNEQQARMANVIREAKKLSGWKQGDKRGFAVHFSFNSWVAVVADVSVKDKVVTFNKLHMAVDCGVPVNPDVIKAQMEGGAGYGLGAMMRNEIALNEGIVQQNNFTDYVPLRISEMPEVEVSVVASDKPPTGVGEPGLPPTIPAVANAIYAQTGERINALPLTRSGYKFA